MAITLAAPIIKAEVKYTQPIFRSCKNIVTAKAKAVVVCSDGKAPPVGGINTKVGSPFTINGLNVGNINLKILAKIKDKKTEKIACTTCSFLIFPSINHKIINPKNKNHIKILAKNGIKKFMFIYGIINLMHKNHPLIESIEYALEGIRYAISSGRNFRIQIGFAILATILGTTLHISSYEWLALILIISSVLVLELVNTAIETVVDMVSLEYHPLAKITKDCAAGAVLISAFASILIGIIIFLPKLFGNL